MAGIKEAMKRVMDKKNVGHVEAIGILSKDYRYKIKCTCDDDEPCEQCVETKYLIIRLVDGGLITQYDNGSDIHIASDIEVEDKVILMINDNWNATWETVSSKVDVI